MSTEKKVIEILGEFGLPSNATKAYIALLKNNPATGYEISNRAGIPRSAIYSVLNRLESKNIINSIGDTPKKYVPLSPLSLIEHLERLNSDRLESLRTAFDSLDLEEEVFDYWHINGYKQLILRIKEAINNAQKTIFLSIWKKEYDALITELSEAVDRGVDVIIFSFCELYNGQGTIISYGVNEDDLSEIWGPKAIIVVDQSVTIMGRTMDTTTNKAIWTNNDAITEIARNHIVLDITLAGQRIGIDVDPIVKRMMKRVDIDLDRLLH